MAQTDKDNEMNGSRRSFFGAAAGAGAALTGTAGAKAAPGAYKRQSPSSTEMIEVGVITCGGYTHIAGIWGPFMNPPLEANRGEAWPRTTGMVMTMVWDQDRAVA